MKKKILSINSILFLILIGGMTFSNMQKLVMEHKELLETAKDENGTTNTLMLEHSVLDTMYESDINEKNGFIDLNGLFYRLCHVDCVKDIGYEVVKMKNNQLTFINDYASPIGVEQDYIKLKSYVSSYGGDFIYIQAPFKINKYKEELPVGITDGTNRIADDFLAELEKNQIEYIDLREIIENSDEVELQDIFYNTDHHWNLTGGLWCTNQVSRYFHKKYGIALNEVALDENNYNMETYEDFYLGSQGRRVGKYYAGLDDVVYPIPLFETDMSYSIPTVGYYSEGEFRDLCLVPLRDTFNNVDLYERNAYAILSAGDQDYTVTV